MKHMPTKLRHPIRSLTSWVTAICPDHASHPDLEPGQEHEVEVTVEYRYTPGTEAVGPSWSSGGEPGDDPEVELVSVLPEDAELRAIFGELVDVIGPRDRERLELVAIEQGDE